MVKFIPFKSMTLNEYLKFEKLTRKITLVEYSVNKLQTNSIHRDCIGEMYIVDWHKSEFEKDFYFSKICFK
jgi:hypothetical protein